MYRDERITYLARTNFRGDRRVFGIRQRDRRSHLYLIGKTGTGKSTLLETMIRQDVAAGEGVALFDPHGDLAERVLAAVPEARKKDLVYFDAPATNPPGFNPLEPVAPERRALAASGLLEAFKKIWAESWGPRLEHILRNALLALLDQPAATLADVRRLLDEPMYRRAAMLYMTNQHVREFWQREYESYPARFRAEAIAPLQNKVGAFLSHPQLHRILTQAKSAFDLRRVMDDGKILVVNLAKGKIGEDGASLLGALLVARIGVTAVSRADVPESNRRDFHVFLDEFHAFTTGSLAGMMAELRKYRVNLVLAHQHLAQLEDAVRHAVLANAGSIIAFRVGLADAEALEGEFSPEVRAGDLVGLPNRGVYLKLMIDGLVSRPFSAETLHPA